MAKNAWLFCLLALVLGAPLLLRPKADRAGAEEQSLVIISPHNEATRHEFARAFEANYRRQTGRTVRIDWRSIGGGSEISRYLASQYAASFQYYWTNALHRPWKGSILGTFDNPKAPPDDPARQAFLASNVGCGIDLLFGGGTYDFIQQAAAGRLIDSGLVAEHPELFGPGGIPQEIGGEILWDREGRWVGACLGAFGICYNLDALARLQLSPPQQWSDLAHPAFLGEIALADPTQSGSVAKAFEMLIQQQMAIHGDPAPGWAGGLQLIQKISANARYFTDSGTKVPYDVEVGDAAAGMCIDFYGRFQSEASRRPDGRSRMQYVSPRGGSSVGADPIGLLRGGPNAEVARAFMAFVLSPEGQKLWNFRVGVPGGPGKYALRRLPIRAEFYGEEWRSFRSDPGVNPYADAAGFVYREPWTGPLFRVISFTIRAMCIDPHDELREAWRQLMAAQFPPEATRHFLDVSRVDYAAASRIRETLRSPHKIDHIRLANQLSESFRTQYRHAAELARAGR